MDEENNKIVELILDQLIRKYDIQSEKEYELLKNGKKYIDSAFNVTDEESKIKIANVLMEYLLYKRNGGN